MHESHASYLMAQVSTPFELVESKWQRDMREIRERQQRFAQMQEARAIAVRQQAALMNAPQQQQTGQVAPGQQGQPQQQQAPQLPGPPPVAQAGQMRPPSGPIRVGPNGQPLPAMAPSQQQLLSAVAAATAARQQSGENGANPMANGVRPPMLPSQLQHSNPQVQQQMQMLQAQQMAARHAQAQAQQQAQAQAANAVNGNRVPSGGTPLSQSGNLAASPYAQQQVEIPNGVLNGGDGQHGSPGMNHAGQPQSSPSQQAQQAAAMHAAAISRAAAMQANPQGAHLRLRSGSPQMGNQMQGQPMTSPSMSNAVLQQVVATLQASGQQATPETIRALSMQFMRNVSNIY